MQKSLCIGLFCFSWSVSLFAQDVGLVAALSPTSGCELSSAETVTVQVFNFGPTISTPFDISYRINAGAPITETVSLGSFVSLTSYTHTFGIPADLSIPGSYSFQMYTDLSGDVNTSNDTINGYIVVSDAMTVGGIVNSSVALCILGNSGTLNLSGHTGDVQFWESSTDGGSSWSSISNTTTSESYLNLTAETWYRTIVDNGLCPSDTSSIAVLSIDQPSVGGTTAGPSLVCVPPNSGAVSLSGEQGSVLNWESSDNSGASWNNIVNTTNTESFTNLSATTWYRAQVQNGSCPALYSDTTVVTVQPGAVGGTFTTGDFAVCEGINNGTLQISGYSGVIDHWEESLDGGSTWNTIINSTDSLNYSNITAPVMYRVVVAGCVNDTSNVLLISVDPPAVGGVIASDTTVCASANSGTLSLSGHSGSISDWQISTDAGATWSGLGTTLSTYGYSGLSVSSIYRVIVGSGVCPADTSTNVTVTVDASSSVGSISGPASVCESGNADSVFLSGAVGTITWNSSSDGGVTWSSAGIGTTVSFLNLSSPTIYQAQVQNGVCPADSVSFSIGIDQATIAGTLSSSDTLCYGQNSGTLVLSGNNGIIVDWELSPDATSWSSISHSAATYGYSNLINPEYYRVIVVNGTCPPDTTNTILLDIFPITYNIPSDTSLVEGESIQLTASGGLTYLWAPASVLDVTFGSSVVASPTVPTQIYIEITDSAGCVHRDSIYLNVTTAQTPVVIANLVTRNGDGWNDTWKISYAGPEPINVIVFNSNGQVVYESADYPSDWSGEYAGGLLPDGTYFYRVSIPEQRMERSGTVDLISGN